MADREYIIVNGITIFLDERVLKDWVIAVDPGPKMPPGGWVLRPPRA